MTSFRAPLCIDVLEDRLNSNVQHFVTSGRFRTIFHVQVDCARGIEGFGATLEDACHDLLLKMGLEKA